MTGASNGATSGAAYGDEGVHFRRARGWYLYDDRGRRFADFWQADGTALLGHRPEGLSTRIKNEISRGLWAPLSTPWTARARRALIDLVSVVDNSAPRSSFFLEWGAYSNGALSAPESGEGVKFSLWRPFAGGALWNLTGADLLVPVLPWPLPGLPVPVVAVSDAGERYAERLGAHGPLSPFHAVGIVHVCALLAAAIRDGMRDAGDTGLEEPPRYRKRGIYFVPEVGEARFFDVRRSPPPVSDSWISLRRRALDGGILLPPTAADAIVVPGEVGRREREVWRSLWREP